MRETESVYKLHSMVNKNDLQHEGRVSSGQQKKLHKTMKNRMMIKYMKLNDTNNWSKVMGPVLDS